MTDANAATLENPALFVNRKRVNFTLKQGNRALTCYNGKDQSVKGIAKDMSDTISIQEALVYIMVVTSAADGRMTDSELGTIGDIAKTLPVFDDYNAANVLPASQRCGDRLQAENGMNDVLDLIAHTVPPHLYDTAYALAVEVAAADRDISREEIRILQLLRDRFSLDKLTVAALERSAIARHRKA